MPYQQCCASHQSGSLKSKQFDVVEKQIKTGQSADTDVVTVISMGEGSTVLIDRQPWDWHLFNTLVDMRKTRPKDAVRMR